MSIISRLVLAMGHGARPSTLINSRMATRLGIFLALTFTVFYGVSWIHPEPVARKGDLSVIHPWARGVPRAGTPYAVFLTIRNDGSRDDHLMSIASPFAERATITQVTDKTGSKRALDLDSLILPAGGETFLRPDQAHIMLAGLRLAALPGQTIPITLRFKRGSVMTVYVRVEDYGQPEHDDHFPRAKGNS